MEGHAVPTACEVRFALHRTGAMTTAWTQMQARLIQKADEQLKMHKIDI